MPEELCQVSPKSHYVSLALHSDPSPYIFIFYLSFIIYIYDEHSMLATGDRITLFLHRHLLFKIRFQIGPHPLQFPLCDKDENQKIESIELRLSEVNAESR